MIRRTIILNCEITQVASATALFFNVVITRVLTPGTGLPLSVSSYNLGSNFTMSESDKTYPEINPGSWIYSLGSYILACSPVLYLHSGGVTLATSTAGRTTRHTGSS